MTKSMTITIASAVVALMVIFCAVPLAGSEDSDALTGNSNISLNAQQVVLYTESTTQNSFNFTVNMSGCTSGATSVVWSTNAIGSPQATVSFSNVTDTSVTVTATGVGSIEIVATADANNYASAVVAVQTSPDAAATEFNFYIKIDTTASDYTSSLVLPSNLTLTQLNNGFWLTVTQAQVAAKMGANVEFNALNAFKCAVIIQNELVAAMDFEEGETPVYWTYSVSDYGWFNSFLGLGTYSGDNGSWIYWAQYHGIQDTAGAWSWAFNNYVFGELTTVEYKYIGMVFWPSPADMSVPTPFPTLP